MAKMLPQAWSMFTAAQLVDEVVGFCLGKASLGNCGVHGGGGVASSDLAHDGLECVGVVRRS